MNREKALDILNLPEYASGDVIDEAYNQMREFFYPPYYGSPWEYTPNQVQENLYESLSGSYYKKSKGIDYRNMIPNAYHHALFNYARVCQAFDYLTNPKNLNEFGEDRNSPYGYDVAHYGKTIASLRKMIPLWVNLLNIPVILGYLIFGIIGELVNGKDNFFLIASEVMKYIYMGMFVSNWITMPLDMLLLIPKTIWSAMRDGATIGSWITKPLSILFLGAVGALAGVMSLFIFPGVAIEHRITRYDPPIKNPKKGREMAKELYRKALQNIEEYSVQPHPYIDGSEPVIRGAIEKLIKDYKSVREELRHTQDYHDSRVETYRKIADWKLEEDVVSAEYDYCQALRERDEAVETKEYYLRIAEQRIVPFLQRVGRSIEDYSLPEK